MEAKHSHKKGHHFLIGAPKSNSGKTLISLALMRAFLNKGHDVQPFKCGPDFIDPIWHEKATGKPSINLDLFMMDKENLFDMYHQRVQEGKIGISEGVMGLFDGAVKDKGSSAEIAEFLDIPIIMVVDASAMAYSAAPLLFGFKNFSKTIRIAGVIFNKVNSVHHFHLLKEACEDINLEVFGYFPQNNDLKIPSRHLGLSLGIIKKYENIINQAANEITQYVDLNKILQSTNKVFLETKKTTIHHNQPKKLEIAIAKDEAFTFMYQKNIEMLANFGKVIFFSPLIDKELPPCDFLYLPGGYPELFLEDLCHNTTMVRSIKNYCLNNGAVYAECGGLMYLGETISYENNEVEMVNFLSLKSGFNKKFTLGYRTLKLNNIIIRGHEFHYSSETYSKDEDLINFEVFNARNKMEQTKIYKKQQTLATYLHLYWGNNPEFLKMLFKFLIICKE